MRRLLSIARWIGGHGNVSVALALAVACVIVGLATGFWLLFRLAYIVAFAVPLVWFWTRSMIRNLDVEVLRRTHRVSQGQPLEGQVLLRSTSLLPKVWLEVEDQSSIPSYRSKRVVTIGARGSAGWSYSEPALQRGLYRLGPIRITATDPFGFFRMTREFGEAVTVLVYPAAPDLPNFYIPPANLPGEGKFRRRTHNVTPNYAGLRQYVAGDSYNRIHWPQTARTGNLMVKLFELDPSSDIWVVLDLDQAVHHGTGEDSTEEVAVTVAASIIRFFIQAHRSVGLISFGSDLRVDDPDRGQNHHTRMLESLALARAVGDIPLDRLLIEISRRFGRHTTVVVVTPSPDESWAMTLMSLGGRGVKVAAVLLEGETWGASRSSLDVYGTLAAAGIYTYTVKQTDELARALGGRGELATSEVAG
ncbi:MAG: DUF58 domain-containing protein [Dehalococcoidia bacterium]|nr:DUF58 domain-containing protein [Dehalococcoidia bacterium]